MRIFAIALFSVLAVGVYGYAHAAGPFGPPEPLSDEDRNFSVGVGYFWNEAEWDPDDPSVFPSIKMGQNIAFFNATTIVSEAGEGFLRLGMANLKETSSTGAFEGDYKGYASVGLKELWYGEGGRRRSSFGAGPILQGSYHLKYEEKQIPLGIGGTADVEIDKFWDASLALGLQWRLNDPFLIFGAPFGGRRPS